jgi:hypothetical protein
MHTEFHLDNLERRDHWDLKGLGWIQLGESKNQWHALVNTILGSTKGKVFLDHMSNC